MALTFLRIPARWRSARVLLTSANWACASSTAFCTVSGSRTAETITCTFLKYEPPRLPDRSELSAFAIACWTWTRLAFV